MYKSRKQGVCCGRPLVLAGQPQQTPSNDPIAPKGDRIPSENVLRIVRPPTKRSPIAENPIIRAGLLSEGRQIWASAAANTL